MTPGPGTTGRASLLLAVALAGAGFLLGRFSAGSGPRPNVATAQGSPTRPGPGTPDGPGGCQEAVPLRIRLADLERRYQALGLLLAASVKGPGGPPGQPSAPLPFPPRLAAPMLPANFMEASKAILERCFPAIRVQDSECQEYPCVAWATYDAGQELSLDMRTCAAWSETMGGKSFVWQRRSPAGATGYLGIASLPEEAALEPIAAQHLHPRLRTLAEAYGIRQP